MSSAKKKKPLNVVCVKVKPKYDAEYVNKLYRGVARNLTQPFKFICLTDEPSGIDPAIQVIPVTNHRLPGWWQKISLFKPLAEIQGRILYFDLDTVITGPLTDVASYDGEFAIIKPFYRPFGFMSSVMAFESGFGQHVWTEFMKNPEANMQTCAPAPHLNGAWGDQRWLEMCFDRADYVQDLFPGQFVSYKADALREGRIPVDARVVLFHGEPRPHEVDGWVRQYWL